MKKIRVLFLSQVPLIKFGLMSGFQQIGMEVDYLSDPEHHKIWEQPFEEHLKLLLTKIHNFKPDLIFTEGYGGLPLIQLRKCTNVLGIPIFAWAIEDPVTTQIGDYFSEHSDHIFTTTLECLPRYRKNGKSASLLMFGVNPEYHKNVGFNPKYAHDIALCASNYSNRFDKSKQFIMPLLDDFKVDVYGLCWDDFTRPVNLANHMNCYHGVLPYEELPSMYSSATIALGSQCSDRSFTQQSMRDFEVLGCGHSILLSYYTKAQEICFYKHVYLAKDYPEMRDMAKEILGMTDAMRKEFATNAQEFVYRNHNYRLKAYQILDVYNGLHS